MGIFKNQTHDSSSSSMTYAPRWKYESLSKISVAAIVLIAITLTVLLIVSIQGRKQVYLVMDGQVNVIETQHAMLQEMLNEQAIMLRPEDNVSMALDNKIKDGDKIHIQRALAVNITADGQSVNTFTTQGTVNDTIKQLGITLDEHDKIFPDLNTKITDKLDIRIVRINKQMVERVETIPFQVIKTSDPSIMKGNVKIVQNGQSGAIVQHIEKIYEDGQFVTMSLVNKEVRNKVQDKVVAVGTKVEAPKPKPAPVILASAKSSSKPEIANVNNRTSKAGVDFTYKKVLKNVSMTAYSSEEPGIGTRTASGTRVTEGRTIAVDKNVIPMGWWVYIEGIGFRRAEDTGGAIKGNKIDVYYDSLQNARNFGRKNGRTVYVIGPVKPQLN
ncbi:3D domain-containing protein [Paenibacillus sp. CMAA1364]